MNEGRMESVDAQVFPTERNEGRGGTPRFWEVLNRELFATELVDIAFQMDAD